MADISGNDQNGVIKVPIDGALDLHNFSPKDLKYLIPDYLEECRKKNIFQVRIIHGKGTGALRRAIREHLFGHPLVTSAGPDEGPSGEGVTVVVLR